MSRYVIITLSCSNNVVMFLQIPDAGILDDEFFSKPKRRGKFVATVDTSVESTSVENSGGEEMEVGTRNDQHASSDEFAVKGNLKLFRISKPSRKILKSRGVSHLFPIQYLTFDSVYDGMDVIGQARKLHVHVAYVICTCAESEIRDQYCLDNLSGHTII